MFPLPLTDMQLFPTRRPTVAPTGVTPTPTRAPTEPPTHLPTQTIEPTLSPKPTLEPTMSLAPTPLTHAPTPKPTLRIPDGIGGPDSARAAAVQAISVFVVITLLGATLGLLNMKLDKNRAARKKKKVRGHQ